MKPVKFSLIGGAGFRAQYYLRIAQALPERFQISGMVVRNESKGRDMEAKWGTATYRTLEQLLAIENPDFIVVSVSASESLDYLLKLNELGIPALLETPPAPDLRGLELLHDQLTLNGARVQVAEQYHFHPAQEARLALIQSGQLGKITETTVSISHLYHGVSLIRKMLGVTFEEVKIRAMRFESYWVQGPTRSGPPTADKRIPLQRDLAWLDFGDRLGIYDFTKDQHRSWVRSNHLSVRGERGEIFDNRVLIQQDSCAELQLELKRMNKGELENAEGYFLKGIICGERWVYENPFAPARLYDDEIAIASCLQKMADYTFGGPSFYSLEEASQDQYLGMMIEKAIQTGETITAMPQCWALTEEKKRRV
ncbi:Oxidoreductase family, NAD-binding Rossmann fold [Paenibacillus sp. yr247]|uniref:Gfo/Idh/MocA family protein n=1 Tax=Paenibacillus sp. yr247 TaxID=1761880 RepID=UPI000885307D|nr:Gfo/Idh/MocA family oxidoreductase [Paenibacillus sp. yr247]SDN24708.1 Oxidoreductase family, NAD-binding Rossmann fold [Paenibacillus sp. yr247]